MGEIRLLGDTGSSNSRQALLVPMPVMHIGTKNGSLAEQDKGVAHFESHPASEGSDGGKPTQRQQRRNRPTKKAYKDINAFAQDFGPSLLKTMENDKDFMEEVEVNLQNEHYLHDLASGRRRDNEMMNEFTDFIVDELREVEKKFPKKLSPQGFEDLTVIVMKIAILGMDEMEAELAEKKEEEQNA